ncbi:MAG TPA: collagen-like repeat preface domain-containing protein, partial [Polyangia bacterium]|nr:collagen-like repeat preface domain-containing protein [Polyangia bacterium]
GTTVVTGAAGSGATGAGGSGTGNSGESGASGGCACDTGGGARGSALGLGLLALLLMRTRATSRVKTTARRRAHRSAGARG